MLHIGLKASVILFCLFTSFFGNSQIIKGQLLNKTTSQCIVGARIYIVETEQLCVSDSTGYFSFRQPPVLPFRIKIQATDYGSQLITIDSVKSTFKIELEEKHIDMQEFTVSGSSAQMQNKNPFHIETRKISELTSVAAMNMGEIISNIPGVYQSNLGNGISKPVIRGQQGMRVVTLINGLRIEGQQWGGDHGMGISELGIGSVEVIKGPASLLYGADALGGVIYFTDENYAATNTQELQASLIGNSNTMGGGGKFLFKQSNQNLKWMIGSSYTNHADFQLASEQFAKNSRFNEWVIKSALSWNSKNSIHTFRYSYVQSTTGIPGHTHDTLINFQDFQVDDQKRKYELPAQFFSNHYFSFDNKWYYKKNTLHFLLGSTWNKLIEYDEKVTIPSINMSLFNSLYSLKWIRNQGKKLKLIAGVQGMLQNNRNGLNPSDTLVPNANTLDNGIYGTIQYEWKKWNFQAGIRFDNRRIETFDVFHSINPVVKSFNSPNGSIGSIYNSGKFTFRTNLSSGFRSPHLSELLANGFHHGALRYEIGDINLKPEKATQIDVTAEINQEHLVWIINPFINFMTDYIYILPSGAYQDGMPVFTYKQLNQVLFYGSDIGMHYHPHFAHRLHIETSVSLIYAQSATDSSVSLLPQPRIQNTFKYTFDIGKKFKLKDLTIQYAYMAKQNQVAFNELSSDSYHLLHAALSFDIRLKSIFSCSFGCKNILNTNYIDHLSRLKNIQMPNPGRNFYISLSYKLSNNLKNKTK